MGFFSKQPEKSPCPWDRLEAAERERERQIQEKQKAYIHDLLERLAKEAEPGLLLHRDEDLQLVRDEYEKDFAGFAFECRRWGAFMTVSTRRDANPPPGSKTGWRAPEDREFSTSLNIKNCGAIRLVLGHPADEEATIRYHASMKSDDGKGVFGSNFCSLPSSGYHYEVWAERPWLDKYGRRHFHMMAPETRDGRDNGAMMSSSYPRYEIKFKTVGYPRVAKDDEIHFDGLNATLFVPAGKGREVNEQILLATEGM